MKNKPLRFLRDIRTHSHPHTAAGQCKTLYFMFQCVRQLMWLCPSCGWTPSSWPDTRRDFHVRRGASCCSNKRWLHPSCWLARPCVCVCVCMCVCVHFERSKCLPLFFSLLQLFLMPFSAFFFLYSSALTVRIAQAFSLLCFETTHTWITTRYHLFNTSGKPGLFEMETYSRVTVTHPGETEYGCRLTGIDWPVLWWSSWPFSLDYNWWREEWNAHMNMLHSRALCLIYCPCVPLI